MVDHILLSCTLLVLRWWWVSVTALWPWLLHHRLTTTRLSTGGGGDRLYEVLDQRLAVHQIAVGCNRIGNIFINQFNFIEKKSTKNHYHQQNR